MEIVPSKAGDLCGFRGEFSYMPVSLILDFFILP